ncbi:MAG: adenosylcobinamide-phosphate synthase CbiB [Eubacteriales bacterium]|nr:adenosylcobinamide-phosphate synthase CbiB [Eubacteriales bacterium]
MNGWQQVVQNRIWVLLIAAAVDLLIGDPQWLWHPVQGIGTLVTLSERWLRRLFRVPPREEGAHAESIPSFQLRERAAGTLMAAAVLFLSTGTAAILFHLCGRIHPLLGIAAEGILCGRLLALRSLGEAGFSVRDPLLRGDTEGARQAVSMIVGRDTQRLDAEGIAKAAVETVAENTSDGVTAPLFYMILFGGIGGVFYKAVNTMDSMVGYKNARCRYFGTSAARLDDIMNYIPSRLTALLMIMVCFLPGKTRLPADGQIRDDENCPEKNRPEVVEDPGTVSGDAGDAGNAREKEEFFLVPDGAAAFRIWRRDRRRSPSPNSAQTESVCAGALHLRLLGDTWYFGELHHKEEIGDGGRRVGPEDITRAVRLMNRAAFLMFVAGILAAFMIIRL